MSWHATLQSATPLRVATIRPQHTESPLRWHHGVTWERTRHGVTGGKDAPWDDVGKTRHAAHPNVMACRRAECHLPAGRHNPYLPHGDPTALHAMG